MPATLEEQPGVDTPEPAARGRGGWAVAAARLSGPIRLLGAARRWFRRRAGSDLLRMGFDASPHPMWVVEDRTLRVLAANAAVARRFGYTPDELRRLTLTDLCPAEDRGRLADAAPGRPVPLRHRTRAGALVEVEVTTYPLPAGPAAARLLVAGDAPDQRRTEAALRERENLLRNVIAHIPVGVFWKDKGSLY
ncbi:MAG TPA: PAS domain-containing protein, partial [Urbifossiella sp.]|nr:PAS domain-containing protein [Urbifossiella sp.]